MRLLEEGECAGSSLLISILIPETAGLRTGPSSDGKATRWE